MRVVGPFLDRKFIHDSYACRKGKGVHAAVDRYQCWARRYPYVLKMDVSQYFPSIDHALLKQKIARRVADADVLWLFDRIIDSSPVYDLQPVYFPDDDLLTPVERQTGLPIGNLTSQFLANLYLDDLDHFLKQELKTRAYLRYVDDLIVLGENKSFLHQVRNAVEEKLADDRLRLHPRKRQIMPVRCGVDVFGYYVFPYSRRLRNDNGHRFARRLRGWAKAYARHEIMPGGYRSAHTELDRPCDAWRYLGLASQAFFGYTFYSGACLKSSRVLRGGSWNNKPRNLRSANRNRNTPDNRNNNNGFRLAQSARCYRSSGQYAGRECIFGCP